MCEVVRPNSTGNQTHSPNTFILFYNLHLHTPLVFLICTFGILSNCVNILVLTRKCMLGPTNLLLTGLSVAQLGLVLNYITLTLYDNLSAYCIPEWNGFALTFYKLVSVNLNIIFHTVALCHTVVLALFRYAAVRMPTNSRNVVSTKSARYAVMGSFLAVPIICLPVYFSTVIQPVPLRDMTHIPCNFTKTDVLYDLRYSCNPVLTKLPIWMLGTVFKLLPCIIIVVFSFLLIGTLKKVEKRKSQLVSNLDRQRAQRNRITVMLLIIVTLFVAIELPQGTIAFLVAMKSQSFTYNVYNEYGPLFEMLTLLYSSINFILYCTMSTQFQNTFKAQFYSPWANHVIPVCQNLCISFGKRYNPISSVKFKTDEADTLMHVTFRNNNICDGSELPMRTTAAAADTCKTLVVTPQVGYTEQDVML